MYGGNKDFSGGGPPPPPGQQYSMGPPPGQQYPMGPPPAYSSNNPYPPNPSAPQHQGNAAPYPGMPPSGTYGQQPMPGQGAGYPPSQGGGYPPTSQGGGYPPTSQGGGYPPTSQGAGGYAPTSQTFGQQGSNYPPSTGGGYPGAQNPYGHQQQQGYYPGQPMPGAYPQGRPNVTVVAKGAFDSGARFDGISQPNIPPPPPGCMPNAAQMASMQGHTVVATQKKFNMWCGDDGAGYTW